MKYFNATLNSPLERPIGTLPSGPYTLCRPDKETAVLIEPSGRTRYLDAGQYGAADLTIIGPAEDYRPASQDIQQWLRDNANAKACKGLDGYSADADQEDGTL